ncbi:MAG: UbiA family prenyltransferase [Granulosicoccus sp.]
MSAHPLRIYPSPEQNECSKDPLVVDLDGTLIRTDTLIEQFAAIFFNSPLKALQCLASLRKGRAEFKQAVAQHSCIDLINLPRREALVAYLQQERAAGRSLHLVSAANNEIVQQYGHSLGMFDTIQGSSETLNLKGRAKRKYLDEQFPEGYVYAGDSNADLVVWAGASAAVLAGTSPRTARRAATLNIPIEREFDTRHPSIKSWVKSLRLHQWSKNLLLFVPLVMSSNVHTVSVFATCLFGFLLMGMVASATYVINDAADIESDRRHPVKKLRPLASGTISLQSAMMAAPLALVLCLGTAFWLNTAFAQVLTAYLIITLGYSFKLKSVPILDVMILAILYCLRLLMGMALAGVLPSVWLLTFAAFLFFSMSLVKRFVEICEAKVPENEFIHGRGYKPIDAPLVLSMGVAASVASVWVIIQYLMTDAFPSELYSAPDVLWLTPLILGLWIGRVWLLANRGELDQDPVAFAIQDSISLLLGSALVMTFIAARFSVPL